MTPSISWRDASADANGRADVACAGEVLVDLISQNPRDSLRDAERFHRHVGGQAANLALNVARLGGRAQLFARVGDDGLGAFALDALSLAGVDVSPVSIDPDHSTTLAVVARSTGTPDFVMHRGADSYLDASDLPDTTTAVVAHASASAMAREPARAAILDWLRRAAAADGLTSLDPNYHAALWSRACDCRAVVAEACEVVDVVKPSLDDASRLLGEGRAEEEYAQQFMDWGAKAVVLSLGSRGALVATQDGELWREPSRAREAVDVTGAGDALWAGLLMALVDGHELHEAVCAGLEVAALKLATVGPLPAAVDRHALYARALDDRGSAGS